MEPSKAMARLRFLTREEVISDDEETPNEETVFYCEVDGLDSKCAVVVRPDMYIGYVGEEQGAWEYILEAV